MPLADKASCGTRLVIVSIYWLPSVVASTVTPIVLLVFFSVLLVLCITVELVCTMRYLPYETGMNPMVLFELGVGHVD